MSQLSGVPNIEPNDFDWVINKLRGYFQDNKFKECHLQNRLDILAACEDPSTIATFEYCGSVFPLPQTNQMRLEVELLTKPEKYDKLFCVTTSYRAEPNPIIGRHDLTFPMFEFESKGTFNDLIETEESLLRYMGFSGNFPKFDYEDLCDKYSTTELTHEHELLLEKEFGPVVFIMNFPERTSPFFNMKQYEDKPSYSKKVDCIIGGMETIGAAERETDVNLMRNKFYTISNGQYSNTLFSRFGKERVEKELEEFLSLKFFPRYGAGCGVTRLIKAAKKYNLF